MRSALGAGGMATVYLADDVIEGHKVAIKVLSKEQIDGSGGTLLERFKREFDACSRLDHPNIVKLYQIGQISGGHWYYSMEYLPSPNLDSILEKHKKIDEKRTLHIVRQIASAFCCFHDKGVIHRDLKPGNIMLCKNGRVVLVDFGLARDENFSTLTATGTVIGTPLYMAPETIIGEKPDNRTDIFALGVMTYELLTGVHPFKARDIQSLAARLLNETPKPVTSLCSDLTPEWDDFIAQSLAKDRNDRYQSGQEIEEDLELISQVLAGASTVNKTRKLHRERLQKRLKGRQSKGSSKDTNSGSSNDSDDADGSYSSAQPNRKTKSRRKSGPTDLSTATSPLSAEDEDSTAPRTSSKPGRKFLPALFIMVGLILFLLLYHSQSSPQAYSSIDVKTAPFPGGFTVTWKSHQAYPTVIEIMGNSRRVLTGDGGHPVTEHEITVTGLPQVKIAAFRIIYPSGETSLEKSATTGSLDFTLLECRKDVDRLLLTWTANLSGASTSSTLQVGDREPIEATSMEGNKWQAAVNMKQSRQGEILINFQNNRKMKWKVNVVEQLIEQVRRIGVKMSAYPPSSVIRRVKDQVDKDMISKTKEFKIKHNKETLSTKELLDMRAQLLADDLGNHLNEIGFTKNYELACAIAPLAFSHQQIPVDVKYSVYHSMMEMIRYALFSRTENQSRPIVLPPIPFMGDLSPLKPRNDLPKNETVIFKAEDKPLPFGTMTPTFYKRPKQKLICEAAAANPMAIDYACLVITAKSFEHFTITIKINGEYELLWFGRPYSGNPKGSQFIEHYQRIPREMLRQGKNKIEFLVERLFDTTLEQRTAIKEVKLQLY